MGLLVDGVWQRRAARRPHARPGGSCAPATRFRNWVTEDGSPGPSGEGGFAAARGRYHLYVSLACPWAHRTLIFRKLKGLEDVISVSVVEPLYGPHGWRFGRQPRHHRRTASTARASSPRSICAPIRATPAA